MLLLVRFAFFVATVYKAMSYFCLQVHSIEDGPAHSAWRTLGVPVNIIQSTKKRDIVVDWLKYVFQVVS